MLCYIKIRSGSVCTNLHAPRAAQKGGVIKDRACIPHAYMQVHIHKCVS